MPPVRSKIVKEQNHFTAGHTYNVTCQVMLLKYQLNSIDSKTFQVLGSRPSALTKIWIGDKKLNLLSTKVSYLEKDF